MMAALTMRHCGRERDCRARVLVIDSRQPHGRDAGPPQLRDVGSGRRDFARLDVFFCSSVGHAKMMEADPMNIAHCPYSIFVTDIEREVAVPATRPIPGRPGCKRFQMSCWTRVTQSALDGLKRRLRASVGDKRGKNPRPLLSIPPHYRPCQVKTLQSAFG